jgi:hypothetical protein
MKYITDKFPTIPVNCLHSLLEFIYWLEDANLWASKNTHYQNLDIWWDSYNKQISKNLDKYGFINGKGAKSISGKFWWEIYGSDPVHSKNLKTSVSSHHASAFERNQAALADMNELYNFYILK